MRVGAVLVDADDRFGLGVQAGLLEGLEDEALHPVFVDRAIGAEVRRYQRERLERDAVQVDVGATMPFELLGRPDRREALREVGGRSAAAQPNEARSSAVPASSRDTLGISLRGLYWAASRPQSRTRSSSCWRCCCQVV